MNSNLALKSEPITNRHRLELVVKNEPEWISTKEAAKILDMELSSVSRLCRENKINCRQYGKNRRSVWEVDKASVLEYRDKDKPVGGRPPKK